MEVTLATPTVFDCWAMFQLFMALSYFQHSRLFFFRTLSWMKHMARLALTKPDFDWSWHDISVSGCWGHGEWDAQGWTEAGLRADGGGSGLRLTNREMVEFFHPSNPKLPYVHDNLRMGCITDDSP